VSFCSRIDRQVVSLVAVLALGCGSWKAPPPVPTGLAADRRALMYAYPAAEQFLQAVVMGDDTTARERTTGDFAVPMPGRPANEGRYSAAIGRMHVDFDLKQVTFDGQLWAADQSGQPAEKRPFEVTLVRGEERSDWKVSRFTIQDR
jgi:hypothetical protein